MRLLSAVSAALLSSFAIASPLANNNNAELETRANTCVQSQLDLFNNDIKYGIPFCKFYYAIERTRSPIPGLTVQEINNVCECILAGTFQPAVKVGQEVSSSCPKATTVTVARTTARSVPVVTQTIATVTQKVTHKVTQKVTKTIAKTTITEKANGGASGAKSTVTVAKTTITQKAAKPSTVTVGKDTVTIAKTTITAHNNAAKTSTLTIAKTTITAKASGNAAKTSTVTIAKTTVTARNNAAKPSTVTIAKTTVTAKASGTAAKASTVTVAKSTVAKTTVTSTKKSTVTIAVTTVTAKQANAQQTTTMYKTITLTGVGSSAKISTVTVAKTLISTKKSTVTVAETKTSTVTASAANTSKSVVTSVKTVYRTVSKTIAASQATVTTTVTEAAGSDSSSTSSVADASTTSSVADASTTSSAADASTTAAASSSSAAASSSSAATASTCSLAPADTAPTTVTVADTEYERFYRGCGYTENTDNPGNAYYSDNFPPVTTTYNSSYTATMAIQQCASDAYYRYSDPNEYLSFDLHFISTTGTGIAGEGGAGYWQCVQYFSEQSDTDASPYFDVANSNVTLAFGYSSGLYSDAAAVNAGQQKTKREEVSPSSGYHPPGRGQKPESN